jgi:hypothetical protein
MLYKYKLTASMSLDDLSEKSVFVRSQATDLTTSAFTSADVQTVALARNSTRVLSFSISSAKYLYIESDKPIYFNINNGGNINLTPQLVTDSTTQYIPGHVLMFTSGMTALTLGNTGTTAADDATVLVVIGG